MSLSNSLRSCVVCGCTERRACILEKQLRPVVCSWVRQNLCSNPKCVEEYCKRLSRETAARVRRDAVVANQLARIEAASA